MANVYLAGNKVRVSVAFTDANGAAIDPTTVSLEYSVLPAVATVVGYNPGTVIRDSAGNYHFDIDTTALLGVVTYEWISTGVGQAAASGQFAVTADPV